MITIFNVENKCGKPIKLGFLDIDKGTTLDTDCVYSDLVGSGVYYVNCGTYIPKLYVELLFYCEPGNTTQRGFFIINSNKFSDCIFEIKDCGIFLTSKRYCICIEKWDSINLKKDTYKLINKPKM